MLKCKQVQINYRISGQSEDGPKCLAIWNMFQMLSKVLNIIYLIKMANMHRFYVLVLLLLAIGVADCGYVTCPAVASFAACYECYQTFPLLPIQCVCNNQQFAILGRCFTATYPCLTSLLTITNDVKYPQYNLWNPLIAPFWQQKVDTARNGTTPPNPLPASFNYYNFSNMTLPQTRGWTQAYFLYQAFKDKIEAWPLATQYNSLFQAATLMQSLEGQANSTKWDSVTIFANSKLGTNYTTAQFYIIVRPLLKQMAPCQRCDTMYGVITKNFITTCSKCSPNCRNCTNQTSVCSTCLPLTFKNDSGLCQECPFAACSICNATHCLQCLKSFSLVNGVCVNCEGNCQQCANGLPNVCTVCIFISHGFTPLDNGTCITCAQECFDCNTTHPQYCVECQDQFYLDADTSTCKSCPKNCLTCGPEGCYQCIYGYGTLNGSCLACTTPGCSSCNDAIDKCSTCVAPHFVFNRTSETCILGNATSAPKVYFNQVIECRAGCNYCYDNNTEHCFSCHERYYQYDIYYCQKCEDGCIQCKDSATCLYCVSGYVLKNGNCVRCPADCRECDATNSTVCIDCRFGYAFSGNKCVKVDMPECLLFNEVENSKCRICMPGFALNSNSKCIQCLSGCQWTCNPKNIAQCRKTRWELGDWFLYEYNLGNEGCYAEMQGSCLTPEDGYKLIKTSSGFNVTIECLYPCATCNTTTCFSCKDGYTFNNGKCSLSFSCNPNCPVCLAGSERNLANNNCIACPVENCASCRNGTCLECFDGYYFDGTSCKACPSKCRKCYDAINCNTCAPGYLWPLQFRSYAYDCVKCNEECLTCKFEANTCTQCAPGMKLINYRCRKQHNIAFTYNLRHDYSDFLANAKSEVLISALIKILKVKYVDIFITDIKSGSTIISGAISAINEAEGRALYNTLKTADISDFTVNGYSVSFMNDNTTIKCKSKGSADCPPGTEELSGGAIAGIVIGGVVGLGIIIGLIVYCCKKRQSTTNTGSTKGDNVQIGSQSIKSGSLPYTDTNLDRNNI